MGASSLGNGLTPNRKASYFSAENVRRWGLYRNIFAENISPFERTKWSREIFVPE